jgi:hypothetical protein
MQRGFSDSSTNGTHGNCNSRRGNRSSRNRRRRDARSTRSWNAWAGRALWRWSVVDHAGEVRELEHRYETRIERLRVALQEFTETATGKTRCAAQVELSEDGPGPLPVFGSAEAALLVAVVKARALAARHVRG